MQKLVLAYFSPTHTTQKVLREISKGMNIEEIVELDLTKETKQSYEFSPNDILLIGAPVYGGRIPPIAYQRIDKLKGNNNLSICVAIYGNIQAGNALSELKYLVEKNNFNVIAGATFIGEHSFSNDKRQIAYKRPNKDDLLIANNFGKDISYKISSTSNIFDLCNITFPGKNPKGKSMSLPNFVTKTTNDCIECGICKTVCPVDAIDDNFKCDGKKCILCNACIKACPENARVIKNPIISLARFALSKSGYKQPICYL